MNNHQIFSANNRMDFCATSIISAYNTHVYGTYKNVVLPEKVDMHCLILTLSGNAKIILSNGEQVSLAEKSIFFGRQSTMHALYSDCNYWHFCCYWFIPHNLNLPINQAFILKNLAVDDENENANKIIRFLQTNVEGKLKYANSFFCYKLLDYLEKINPITHKSNELSDKIIAYINENIEKDIKIKDIADTFHYSEKHIRSTLNATVHLSPKQYILKVKLENVCDQLLNTSLSLQDLAEKYYFASVSHLVNSFKKAYNVTPKQYRNK